MQFKLFNITFSKYVLCKKILWENLLLFNVSEKPTKTMLKNIDFDYVTISISHLHQFILTVLPNCVIIISCQHTIQTLLGNQTFFQTLTRSHLIIPYCREQ